MGLWVAFALASCSGTRYAVTTRAGALPPFTAAEASLFDDTFALSIFDVITAEALDPSEDRKLAERTARADTVVPVKITTVTCDTEGPRSQYSLVLVPTSKALAGRPLDGPVTLVLSAEHPSYGLVRSANMALAGTTLIIMMRHYEVDGREMMHWRAEADTPAVRYAIHRFSARRAKDGSDQ